MYAIHFYFMKKICHVFNLYKIFPRLALSKKIDMKAPSSEFNLYFLHDAIVLFKTIYAMYHHTCSNDFRMNLY